MSETEDRCTMQLHDYCWCSYNPSKNCILYWNFNPASINVKKTRHWHLEHVDIPVMLASWPGACDEFGEKGITEIWKGMSVAILIFICYRPVISIMLVVIITIETIIHSHEYLGKSESVSYFHYSFSFTPLFMLKGTFNE